MTLKEALEDSIAHWERMIEWAKRQPPEKAVKYTEMAYCINEEPNESHCALCKYSLEFCNRCLVLKYDTSCCLLGSIYREAVSPDTWGEWAESAKLMLDLLQTIYKGEGHEEETNEGLAGKLTNESERSVETQRKDI